MHKETYFILLIVTVFPFIFGRRYWVRVICICVLFACALLHWTQVIALHRLVRIKGIEQLESGRQLSEGFLDAANIVKQLNQAESPYVIGLFIAFAVLALSCPCGGRR